MTYKGKPYSSPKNIFLSKGLLRFGETYASNPFGDETYGLYVNSSGELIFRSSSTSTILGVAGGGGSTPSLDAIYAGDKSLAITAGALTLAGSHASNDVLVITNATGSGDCIQITNSGTGNDVEGTLDAWHFTALGAMTALTATLAGSAGSNSLVLTAGDVSFADGSITVVDADNAATLSVTNDTATTASVFVFAGSGAFTGNTTSSFMTLTASGLTTGTVLYIPVVGLTTGKGINLIGTTALTTGIMLNVESGTTGTSLTGAGRLVYVNHTGVTTNSGILSEFASAATDETVILKVTASGALALGTALAISGSSITTGKGLTLNDLDALTDGYGIHIKSTATALSSTGRLLLVEHATSATTTSGVIAEFKTAATDETVLMQLTTAAMINGVALNVVGTTGMTTGSLIRVATSTAGALNTNGIVAIKATGAYTSTSNYGLLDVSATALVGTGTVVNIKATNGSQLTNTLLNVEQTTTTTAYTGNIVQLTGTSTTGDANVVLITSANTTDGRALKVVSGVTTTNGSAVLIQANALTTGVGLRFAHTTSVIADGGSMVRLSSSGVDTGGATNGVILDIAATGATAATLVKMVSSTAAQTAVTILDIVSSGYTTGFTGSVVKMTGASTTGSGNVLLVTGANTTAGETVKIDAAALTTGTGLLVTSAGVIVTTGELVSLVANGATTSTGVLRLSATGLTDGWAAEFTGGGAAFTASGGMLKLAMGAATVGTGLSVVSTGVYTGTTGLISVTANSATTGTIVDINATSLTTGAALKITTNTTATGEYINCYDGAAVDFKVSRYGATTIAGNAAGTAALTITAGDLKIDGGYLYASSKVIFNGSETLAAGNTDALDLTKFVHYLDADAGGDTHTLADGVAGQIKTILCKSATGVVTVTPANLAGGTSVTMNAEGDCVILQFFDTNWFIIGGNGYTVI
jgi:hypothetical protein